MFPHSQMKDGAAFFHGRVNARATPHSEVQSTFLFISLTLLPHLRETPQLNSDGTFRSVPTFFSQLNTIHLDYMGKVEFLLCYKTCVQLTNFPVCISEISICICPDVWENSLAIRCSFNSTEGGVFRTSWTNWNWRPSYDFWLWGSNPRSDGSRLPWRSLPRMLVSLRKGNFPLDIHKFH